MIFLHIRLAQVCYFFFLCLFPFHCFCNNRMSQLMKLFKGLEGALVLVKNLTYRILILNVLSYWCIQFYSTKFNTYSFVIYYKMSKMIQSLFVVLSLNLYRRKAVQVLSILDMVIGRAFGQKWVAFIHLRLTKQLILMHAFVILSL